MDMQQSHHAFLISNGYYSHVCTNTFKCFRVFTSWGYEVLKWGIIYMFLGLDTYNWFWSASNVMNNDVMKYWGVYIFTFRSYFYRKYIPYSRSMEELRSEENSLIQTQCWGFRESISLEYLTFKVMECEYGRLGVRELDGLYYWEHLIVHTATIHNRVSSM